ncbi:MAG: tripartite tricarboxylate transporter substrate binding protein [Desulfovermiculus sp.]|nr:tripartite tricarboxylate transporter substrate binding protein [Desulfovermiculus sp.]
MNSRKRKLNTGSLVRLTFMMTVFSLATLISLPAQAADYPSKPFNYIVPFSPGGTTDLQARVFEKYWKDTFDQPIKVEYVTGAGGQVGWDALVDRKADGYTVAGNNLPHIIMQPIFRDTNFTTQDHIDGAVAGLVTDPEMITVLKDSPYKDIHDLVKAAKENPGAITAGVVGKFTGDWLGLKLFEDATDTEFAEVIFPGSRPTVAALLGGHIACMFGNTGDIKTLGPENVRTLAVGAKETPAVLDPFIDQIGAPTAHEKGIEWYAAIHRGLVTVPGTPKPIVDTLRNKVGKIITTDAYAQEMQKVGLPMLNRPGQEYAEFIEQRQDKILSVLKNMGYIEIENGEITVLKR